MGKIRYSRLVWGAVFLSLVLLVRLIFGLNVGPAKQPSTHVQAGAITATPTVRVRPTEPQTVTVNPTPTLSGPALDATKQAWLDNELKDMEAAQTQVAQNATKGVPTRVRSPLPTPKPIATPVDGLSTCGNERDFDVHSCWMARVNDWYIGVTSGAVKSAASVGAIEVFTITLNGGLGSADGTYSTPQQEGPLSIAYPQMPLLTLLASHLDRPTSVFVFNLLTRQWEDPGAASCPIFPLAFRDDTFAGVKENGLKEHIMPDIPGAAANATGAFAWIDFRRSSSDKTQQSILPRPGDKISLINPADPADTSPSVGDWMQALPQPDTSLDSERAFQFLYFSGFKVMVPLWDEVAGSGTDLRYHISGFAWFRLGAPHAKFPPDEVAIRYWGPASCP